MDGVTFGDYAKHLDANLADLVRRLKDKRYHARLVRRKYIPKGQGKLRPLGILTLGFPLQKDLKAFPKADGMPVALTVPAAFFYRFAIMLLA